MSEGDKVLKNGWLPCQLPTNEQNILVNFKYLINDFIDLNSLHINLVIQKY